MRYMERVTWKLTLPYGKQTASRSLLYVSGNSNRGSVSTSRGGGGRRWEGASKGSGTCIPMVRFDRKQQNSVKQLSFNKKKLLLGEISTISDMKMIPLYKEYCTGTWNVRFMNQSKLDVVK